MNHRSHTPAVRSVDVRPVLPITDETTTAPGQVDATSLVNGIPSIHSSLLLRPDEAAAVLAIGRSTLYELVDSGDVPSVRIGRSRRFRRSDLVSFVNNLPTHRTASQ